MESVGRYDILIVEDEEAQATLYCEILKSKGLRASIASDGLQTFSILEDSPPRVLLLDLGLPDMDGVEILKHIKAEALPTYVIVVSAREEINYAVEAMRLGAYDYLVKPIPPERLITSVKNALDYQKLYDLVDAIRQDFRRDHYGDFIGSSLPMQMIYKTIDAVSQSKASIFIKGESGTGKELCARAIHQNSPRKDKPFIAINCAAIPENLMESTLFGHIKGAFTGAGNNRKGAAFKADNGTLFLDEICDLSLNLQAKLLRFIQTGIYKPVGSDDEKKSDIRFICATNKDPAKLVKSGKFREDLYYRLHVVPIKIPPLRDRSNDVIDIARQLLKKYAKEEKKKFIDFSPQVEACFKSWPWPGNVRELENIIRNIVVLNNAKIVDFPMLPEEMTANGGEYIRPKVELDEDKVKQIRPLWQEEKEVIERAINHFDGNIYMAATALKISPSTIYRKKLSWQNLSD